MTRGAVNRAVLVVLMLSLQALGAARGAAEFRAPDAIAAALKEFAKDYGDLVRKLNNKTYDRMAREDQDFQRDAEALRKAIATEPVEFRTRVESAIAQCLQSSADIAGLGKSQDDVRLSAALEVLRARILDLNALVPEPLRTKLDP